MPDTLQTQIKTLITTLTSPSTPQYGSSLIRKLTVFQAQPGKITFELVVDEDMLNPFGALHGGAIALLIDVCTTLALISANIDPGSSVDLSAQYLSSAKNGDTIHIEAEVSKVGGNLAFTRTVIRVKDGGKMIATGSHIKFLKSGKL